MRGRQPVGQTRPRAALRPTQIAGAVKALASIQAFWGEPDTAAWAGLLSFDPGFILRRALANFNDAVERNPVLTDSFRRVLPRPADIVARGLKMPIVTIFNVQWVAETEQVDSADSICRDVATPVGDLAHPTTRFIRVEGHPADLTLLHKRSISPGDRAWQVTLLRPRIGLRGLSQDAPDRRPWARYPKTGCLPLASSPLRHLGACG